MSDGGVGKPTGHLNIQEDNRFSSFKPLSIFWPCGVKSLCFAYRPDETEWRKEKRPSGFERFNNTSYCS